MKKVRADILIVAQGLAPTRQRAQALIMAGAIFNDADTRIEKPGTLLPQQSVLRLKENNNPYVSRGGLKLEGALEALKVDPNNWVCADFGASTGGFTDCLLQRGARKVYAIDVGYGQLHPKIRSDARVVTMERTNARHLQRADLQEQVNLVTIDASFIGLAKLLPAAYAILKKDGLLLGMIKPQFEVGAKHLNKKGVVKDESLRLAAVAGVIESAVEMGFCLKGQSDAVIQGPEGNQETFILMQRTSRGKIL